MLTVALPTEIDDVVTTTLAPMFKAVALTVPANVPYELALMNPVIVVLPEAKVFVTEAAPTTDNVPVVLTAVGVITVFTVELPTFKLDVVMLTFAPTLIAVALTVPPNVP